MATLNRKSEKYCVHEKYGRHSETYVAQDTTQSDACCRGSYGATRYARDTLTQTLSHTHTHKHPVRRYKALHTMREQNAVAFGEQMCRKKNSGEEFCDAIRNNGTSRKCKCFRVK